MQTLLFWFWSFYAEKLDETFPSEFESLWVVVMTSLDVIRSRNLVDPSSETILCAMAGVYNRICGLDTRYRSVTSGSESSKARMSSSFLLFDMPNTIWTFSTVGNSVLIY